MWVSAASHVAFHAQSLGRTSETPPSLATSFHSQFIPEVFMFQGDTQWPGLLFWLCVLWAPGTVQLVPQFSFHAEHVCVGWLSFSFGVAGTWYTGNQASMWKPTVLNSGEALDPLGRRCRCHPLACSRLRRFPVHGPCLQRLYWLPIPSSLGFSCCRNAGNLLWERTFPGHLFAYLKK